MDPDFYVVDQEDPLSMAKSFQTSSLTITAAAPKNTTKRSRKMAQLVGSPGSVSYTKYADPLCLEPPQKKNKRSADSDNQYLALLHQKDKEIERLKNDLGILRKLNESLQEEVIKKFDALHSDDNSDSKNGMPVGQKVNGQVFIGGIDVFIPEDVFLSLMTYEKPNLFLSGMAIAIFGSEVLATKSLTGYKSYKAGYLKEQLDTNKLNALNDVYTYFLKKKSFDIAVWLPKFKDIMRQKMCDEHKKWKKKNSELISNENIS